MCCFCSFSHGRSEGRQAAASFSSRTCCPPLRLPAGAFFLQETRFRETNLQKKLLFSVTGLAKTRFAPGGGRRPEWRNGRRTGLKNPLLAISSHCLPSLATPTKSLMLNKLREFWRF